MEKRFKQEGVTLIALVITIIILIILAGVTINMLVGENGIIVQAQTAKEKTEKAGVIEQAQADIVEKQVENKSELISSEHLKEILEKYFNDVPEAKDITIDTVLTTKEEYGGKYLITVSEIYNGKLEKVKEMISIAESYVGYYADVNGDGTVDGIIYADLAKGNTGNGEWINSDGNYTIPVEEGLKAYYISQKDYEGDFGKKDVLVPTEGGKERFYVMALRDIDEKQNETYYDWYNAASGKMTDYATTTSTVFGKGRENTSTMIEKWETKAYGEKDKCVTHKDIWGQIKARVNAGWFVPSKEEWLAFGGELGITTENYVDYKISDWYWSSSQYDRYSALFSTFAYGYMGDSNVDNDGSVRLSTTF